MIPHISDAIQNLRPGSSYQVHGDTYADFIWLETPATKPSQTEVEQELVRLRTEYAAKEYQRIRAVNYPEIADQLDMLWHSIDTGTLDKSSEFYTALKAVKDATPKP